MRDRVTLYGNDVWTSPYVLTVFVALEEKRIPYELKLIALHRAEHALPGFRQTSLTARVPVLVDGDFALSESSAIVDYLEERYAAPAHSRVLPADVRDRARARTLLAWVRSDVMALREERPTWRVFYEPNDNNTLPQLSPQARRGAAKVVAIAEQVVPPGGGPLFGDWCIADTDLAMMLLRLIRTGEPMPTRIRDYAEAQWLRPSVRAFVDRPRPPYAAAIITPGSPSIDDAESKTSP
jgi:glutathione S-transferase